MIDRTNRPGPVPDPSAPPAGGPAAAPAAAASGLAADKLALARGAGTLEPLPGALDDRPLLHSNHPEILHGPGITVSSFNWPGPAHLDQDFTGPFEIFCHHQNRADHTLYQNVVLHNPGTAPVTVTVGPSASFSTSEAPYHDGDPEPADDPDGKLVSGPGDAVSAALLRGNRAVAVSTLTLAPGETAILHTRAIPPRNEATSEFQLDAGGPVEAAVVVTDQPGTLPDVTALLQTGQLVARNPDDPLPTPPDAPGHRVYGRVAGIQAASAWRGRLAPAGQAIAIDAPLERQWIVNSLVGHDGGTGQVQSAPLLKRYPDAAYAAHGNYGVCYDLTVPLANPGGTPRRASLYLDSLPAPGQPPTPSPPPTPPLLARLLDLLGPLRALVPAPGAPVSRSFRGELAIDVTAPDGTTTTRYVHLSQLMGQRANQPLLTLEVPPGTTRDVRVRFYYPADATAPQVLRLETPEAAP